MTPYKIELCGWYTTTGYPDFKPVCEKGFRAGLWCHKYDAQHFCKKYISGDAWDRLMWG